jgi:hypothetical protein
MTTTPTTTDKPKGRKPPFGALKNKQAELLTTTLQRVAEVSTGPVSMVFAGQWLNRRFVIDTIHPADVSVKAAVRDLEKGTLTLPILPANNADTYVNALRGFGMQIEIAERKLRPGFEIVDGPDGQTHRIRKAHHIADCGLRGPWPDTATGYVGASADDIPVSCVACEKKRVDAQSAALVSKAESVAVEEVPVTT